MGGAFLSYARTDDTGFVRRLHADLAAAGVNPWWDLVDMPSRGLTFLHEIRDAIDGRERLVLVLGPAAVASAYVRAEWQYALVADKIVIPVLRRGGMELLPPELKNLDCISFVDDADYADGLRKLLADLRAPPPPLGPLHGVPAPPPHFRPRGHELSELARLALADLREPRVLTATERTVVVHGMGGVGKSVLAAAFAGSTEARRAFPDGVFWLDLRLAESPAVHLAALAREVGVESQGDINEGAPGKELTQAFVGRSGLVVLDNASALAEVQPFVNLIRPAPRMHLLVTSRDGTLATALGGGAVDLRQLAAEVAMEVLADWAGQPAEALPAPAREVARHCGGLPFALALCGAMAQEGNTWADLLGELERANLAFIEKEQLNYPYPDLLKCFQVSLDLLGRGDPTGVQRYREIVVFAAGARIPEAALIGLWQVRAGAGDAGGAGSEGSAGEATARKLLVALARKALVRMEGEAPERWITLHDLQHAFLRATTAAADLAVLHDALTCAYAARCPSGWPSGPRDGYFFQHLVRHLELANHPDEIHRLLALSSPTGLNAWYEARRLQRDVPGYRQDVERALALAVQADPTLSGPASASALALELRYLLVLASARSSLLKLPMEMVVPLVTQGLWSAEEALDFAQADPRPRTLLACARVLPPAAWPRLWALATRLGDAAERADALSALAELSPPWQNSQACTAAWSAIAALPESARADALRLIGRLARTAPAALHEPMLVYLEASDPRCRNSRAIVEQLMPRLDPTLRGRAAALLAAEDAARPASPRELQPLEPEEAVERMNEACSIDAAGTRAQALAALAPRLPEELREAALQAAIDAASSLSTEWMRAARLHDVVRVADGGPAAARLIAVARGIASPQALDDKARMLLEASLHFTDLAAGERLALQRQALTAAEAVEKPLERWRLARELHVALRAPLRDEAAALGLRAMEAMDAPAALQALKQGALRAPWDCGAERFLELWPSVRNMRERLELLMALRPVAGEERWAALVRRHLASASLRPDDLAPLLPQLDDALRDEAVEAGLRRALPSTGAGERLAWLASLAPWLRREQLAQALVSPRLLADVEQAARLVLELAPDLPPETYGQALWALGCLDTFSIILFDEQMPRLLRTPVPPGKFAAVVEAARGIDEPSARIEALLLLHRQGAPVDVQPVMSAAALEAWLEVLRDDSASRKRARLYEAVVSMLVPADLDRLLVAPLPSEPGRPLQAWARCLAAERMGPRQAAAACTEVLQALEMPSGPAGELRSFIDLIKGWRASRTPAAQEKLKQLAAQDAGTFAAVAPAMGARHADELLQHLGLGTLMAKPWAFGEIYPHLSPRWRTRALEHARAQARSDDEAARAAGSSVLAALVPRVTARQRQVTARQALRAFLRSSQALPDQSGRNLDPWRYHELLQALGPALGTGRAQRLLRVARARPDRPDSPAVRLALAPLEPSVQWVEIEQLAGVCREPDHYWMRDPLAALVARLPEPRQLQAWRLLWPMTVQDLARVAPTMSEASRRVHVRATLEWLKLDGEALEQDGASLLKLLPVCSDEEAIEALRLAWSRSGRPVRRPAVALLCERAARGPREPLVPLWRARAEHLRPLERASMFDELSAIWPLLAAVGGDGMAGEVFAAAQAVRRWWP